jgi:hypothetical protein
MPSILPITLRRYVFIMSSWYLARAEEYGWDYSIKPCMTIYAWFVICFCQSDSSCQNQYAILAVTYRRAMFALDAYQERNMPSSLSPQEFVAKWRSSNLRENAAYVEHFIDLCQLVNHPTPASVDTQGTSFTFQAGVTKQSGKQGWADVYKRGFFAADEATLKKRTLTNLYNERPMGLTSRTRSWITPYSTPTSGRTT